MHVVWFCCRWRGPQTRYCRRFRPLVAPAKGGGGVGDHRPGSETRKGPSGGFQQQRRLVGTLLAKACPCRNHGSWGRPCRCRCCRLVGWRIGPRQPDRSAGSLDAKRRPWLSSARKAAPASANACGHAGERSPGLARANRRTPPLPLSLAEHFSSGVLQLSATPVAALLLPGSREVTLAAG